MNDKPLECLLHFRGCEKALDRTETKVYVCTALYSLNRLILNELKAFRFHTQGGLP